MRALWVSEAGDLPEWCLGLQHQQVTLRVCTPDELRVAPWQPLDLVMVESAVLDAELVDLIRVMWPVVQVVGVGSAPFGLSVLPFDPSSAPEFQFALLLENVRLQRQLRKQQIRLARLSQEHLRLHRLNQQLRDQSMQDALTGIPNRRYFDQRFRQEWARMARSILPLSLLMLDVDYFKRFNDTLGHQAGDSALATVATGIRSVLARGGDMVARYGGEEFAIILPDTPYEGAIVVAEQILAKVQALGLTHPSTELPHGLVSVSIGVASAVPDVEFDHPSDLLHAADKALYQAKAAGRNGWSGLRLGGMAVTDPFELVDA